MNDSEKMKQFDNLFTEYKSKYPNGNDTIGALIFQFGYNGALDYLIKAKGREIKIIYGPGIDEIREIRFIGDERDQD